MGTLQHLSATCVRSQAGQAAHRVEPLQALADSEVCGPDRRAGRRVLRVNGAGMARSFQPAGAFGRAGAAAGLQFRGARGAGPDGAQPYGRDPDRTGKRGSRCAAGHGARFPPDAFLARPGVGDSLSRSFSRRACGLRGSGAGRSVRWARCWARFALLRAWAAQGPGELQPLQSLPAQLPGRRRSHRRSSVAQGRMPDVHELRGRVPAITRWRFASSARRRRCLHPTWDGGGR